MFEDVLQSVRNWLHEKTGKYNDRIHFDIISDTADGLSVNIETKRYMGSLNVSMPDFRPYRYVELYILDTQKDVFQAPAFVYHDNENESAADIIDKLNDGIEFILSEK